MAESATIARPYAKAAFEQAQSEGDLRKWAQMLHFLSAVVSDPLMSKVLDNPRIPDQQLLSVVLDICAGQLSETGRNFVTVLSQAGRLALAPEISVLKGPWTWRLFPPTSWMTRRNRASPRS